MNKFELSQLYESLGAQEFTRRVNEMIHSGDVAPDEISVRGLYESLAGKSDTVTNISEAAIDTNSLSSILGNMIFVKMKQAYEQTAFVGDKLVDVLKSSETTETIPGTTTPAAPETVQEGEAYPETGFGEDTYETTTAKKGRLLWITKEAVMRDRTGMILRQAADIGRYIAYERELTILTAIQDLNSTAYKPAGTATALFSSGNGNIESSNALVDYTDLEASRKRLSGMTDNHGRKLLVVPRILLVPDALATTARMIVGAPFIDTTSGASSEIATTAANPFQNAFQVYSSPLLNDETTWYLGDFASQFVWHEVWPLSVERAPANHPKLFTHDIITGFKGSYYGGAAAIDHRYVVKSTA